MNPPSKRQKQYHEHHEGDNDTTADRLLPTSSSSSIVEERCGVATLHRIDTISGNMNFLTIVHGDIGTLVADYLALPSLSAWSQCDRNGRTIVHNKFSHMKRLDLRDHMNLNRTNFGHLCERLRGIEILQWSLDSPLTLPLVATALGSVDYSILRSFQRLLRANASVIRVLNQTERTGKGHSSCCGLSSSLFIETFIRPVLVATREMPHLEVLDVRGVKYAKQVTKDTTNAQPSADTDEHGILVPFGPANLRSEEVVMQQIDDAVPILSEVQVNFYELLQLTQQTRSGVQVAANSSSWSHLRHIRSATMEGEEITNFFRQLPDLVVCTLNPLFSTVFTGDEQSTASMQRLHSIRFSAPNGGPTLTQSLGESLLCLAIIMHSNKLPAYSHISLHLPHVRELIFHVRANNISDITFVCPQLLKADIECTCILPEEEQTNGNEHPLSTSTPPSIINSLRHSTKLQYLCYVGLNGELVNLTSTLSEVEKRAMDAKAASLGQPSLFSAFKPEDRQKHHLRILYYALSLLPCAHHLRLIDDITMRVTFTEYLTLFPSIRSISFIPFWSSQRRPNIAWLRPPSEFDFDAPDYTTQRILSYYLQNARFNSINFAKVLFVKKEKQPTEYIHLADANIYFDLKASQLCLEKGIYTKLYCLFLHGPTRIDSAALTLLFRESRSLNHVSLMQLEVSNEVFTSLPSDYILPALQTLRIKTPCGVSRSQTFNMEVLDRLIGLFPSMRHFELVPLYSGSDDMNRLISVLEPSTPRGWPHLRELSLLDPEQEVAVKQLESAIQPRMSKGEFRLNLIRIYSNTPIDGLRDDWQVAGAHRHDETELKSTEHDHSHEASPTRAPLAAVSVIITHLAENSCFRELCRHHEN